MGELLKAIYAYARNKMYRGLGKPQSRVFPVHQTLKEVIVREWKDPERKVLKLNTWKKRFPFGEEEETVFKTPKLDAALSQVSKNQICPLRTRVALKIKWIGGLKHFCAEHGMPMWQLWLLRWHLPV